ncbi:hypothetical protein OHB12_12595 [Nocardia sp. NBC_01730]|nr:hypothetical protein OHB12_12595 [Nocardia sp. NBC_01730]
MTAKTLTAKDIDKLILADRVHGSLYTDPDIFEAEISIIFEQG